jgi:hypothetical protein
VFPARYELNSYIVFRKRLVSKRLIIFRQKTKKFVRGHMTHGYTQQKGDLISFSYLLNKEKRLRKSVHSTVIIR